ncbi:MAG: hypothetical protein WDM88_06110 [Galbitalea sp.]
MADPRPRGVDDDSATLARAWRFVATVALGDRVEPGDILGTVPEAGSVEHRVLVPSGVAGEVTWLVGAGDVHALDVVAHRRARRSAGRELARAPGAPVPGTPERAGAAADRPARTRPPLPAGQGSAAAVPGGFGTGKTLLLQQIAKWSDARRHRLRRLRRARQRDGRCARRPVENDGCRTAARLIDRTVIIANTSNMPMMAREASIYTGVTVAEYYRDMGYDAVVIADSTSRWAEALREFANRNGDLPAEEGYPATWPPASPFYERAARVTTLGGRTASVTVIGAVSPAGGDMTEPVTTDTQRFVRSLWPLDRDLAYSRHYPAVSWTGSFSRDADLIGVWHAGNDEPTGRFVGRGRSPCSPSRTGWLPSPRSSAHPRSPDASECSCSGATGSGGGSHAERAERERRVVLRGQGWCAARPRPRGGRHLPGAHRARRRRDDGRAGGLRDRAPGEGRDGAGRRRRSPQAPGRGRRATGGARVSPITPNDTGRCRAGLARRHPRGARSPRRRRRLRRRGVGRLGDHRGGRRRRAARPRARG